MAQMPEEGKLFQQVDKNWKDVMRTTVRNPKVHVCTGSVVSTEEMSQLEWRSTYVCMQLHEELFSH